MKRKFVRFVALAAVLALGAVACSDDDSGDTSAETTEAVTTETTGDAGGPTSAAAAADALPAVPAKTIGIVNVTGTSEVSTQLLDAFEQAAKVLGWTLIVKDGDPTPQRWADSVNQLITENVDALLIPLIPAEALGPSLADARAAGIPILSLGVPIGTEDGKALVDADYADDFPTMGVALAKWVIAKYGSDAQAVAQRATISPGADSGVLAFVDTLEAAGGTLLDSKDLDSANLVTSYTQNAIDMLQANPDADVLMECCDSSVTFVLPALAQIERTDVPMLTIYDNPSTIQAMQRGANLVIAAANTSRTTLQAFEIGRAHV